MKIMWQKEEIRSKNHGCDVRIYLHHSTDPEATIDGIDADDSVVGVLQNSVEKPYVVWHHYNKAWRN